MGGFVLILLLISWLVDEWFGLHRFTAGCFFYLESLRVVFYFFIRDILDEEPKSVGQVQLGGIIGWKTRFTRWQWESFEEFLKDFVGTSVYGYLVPGCWYSSSSMLLEDSAPNRFGGPKFIWSGCPLISLVDQPRCSTMPLSHFCGKEKSRRCLIWLAKISEGGHFGSENWTSRGNRGVKRGVFGMEFTKTNTCFLEVPV